MIEIIADSTCDLTQEELDRYGVHLLPLHILMGDEEHRDGPGFDMQKMYDWADANQSTPKTSAPSLEDMIALLEPILERGNDVIGLPIAAPLSSSGNVMRVAAESLGAGDRVHVVDTTTLSYGIGIMAMKATEMARADMPLATILAELESMAKRVHVSFVVDTLTYLYRGGRCSGVAALAGNVLRIHPRIAVTDEGTLIPDHKYRGKMHHVIDAYVDDIMPHLEKADTEYAAIVHSGGVEPELIQRAYDRVAALGRFKHIIVGRAGGVISSHCGPGTFGMGYFDAKN
ncbi:MAG: DegV family protein [Peptococcaceae bacterium]|nr:DegV family protein [Peptococcaceae bacterium]